MKKRIAIGAAVALVATLAFAAVGSASDEFADGSYMITLPDVDDPVTFIVESGAIENLALPDGFELVSDDDDSSDDLDEIEITNGIVVIEIEADDDADDGYTIEVEPVDDDMRSDDDESSDDDASSDDDDASSDDDDASSEDDDSVSGDDADSEDELTGDDARSEDDDSVSGDDDDSSEELATQDDASSDDDDSVSGDDADSEDDDSN